MGVPLDGVCCACLPPSGLASLAAVRCRPGVFVYRAGAYVWLRWEAGDDEVLRRVLPVPGVRLFTRRDGLWYEPGRRLPAFDVPRMEEVSPLPAVVTPTPVRAEPVPAQTLPPVPLKLVRDDHSRPAAALLCASAELGRWASGATTRQITALRAAKNEDRILLLGPGLPALRGAARFWGRCILFPLGFRPEPALPESALCALLGIGDEAIALLTDEGADVVPAEALRPLSRAAARLVAGEAAP
jgi:hypothetical protein